MKSNIHKLNTQPVRLLLLIFIVSLVKESYAQNIDSLWNVYNNKSQQDTNRLKAIHKIANTYLYTNPDTSLIFYKKEIELAKTTKQIKYLANGYNNTGIACGILGNYKEAEKNYLITLKLREQLGDKKGVANCYMNMGNVSHNQSNYSEALKQFAVAIKVNEELDNKQGLADCYNNTGLVYKDQGNYPAALKQYFTSLKMREEIKDKKGVAGSYLNIGYVYANQKNTSEALKQYTASLKLYKELDNIQGISSCYNNMGIAYKNQRNYPEALKQYAAALKLLDEIGDKQAIANCYNNIGVVYESEGDYPKALVQYIDALKIREEIGDKQGIAASYYNIGSEYNFMHKSIEAKPWLQKSLDLSKEIGDKETIKDVYICLSEVEKQQGNYKDAYENYKMFTEYRDSIFSEENTKKTVQTQMQYEFDKKQTADSLKVYEERQVNQAKFKQERTQRYALYGGLALLVLFAGFMFNRFKISQKQNTIITKQKHVIEERHKEITDSINYAERIQRSMLATKKMLNEHLSIKSEKRDYFIFFKPKDVVSGDFYWSGKLANGNFALATADSTGHGVPGAIMSMLNMNSLKEAVKENFTQPNDILNYTRKIIVDTLANDGSADGGKDGMDCSLCVFDFANKKLFVAAANNPVWIIRTKGAEHDVIEIKPDKMPVGKHDRQEVSFTQHEIQLQSGDVVYTLTDGFPDQFGGGKGKKFLSKNLREFLAANAYLPMHEQKELLEKTFTSWIGNYEQIDDVTLIGIRI